VSALSGITAIAGGGFHSLALKNDGTVWAWGANAQGQLGNGTNTDSNVPVQVSTLSGITAIAGGAYHSLALKNDGTVWAWGYNGTGQLGNGNNTDSNVPVQVTGLCQVLTNCSANFSIIPDTSQLHTYWAINSAIGTPPLNYDWNWGDGSPHDFVPYPSHTYATAGFYTICLSITDASGCSSAYCDTFTLARMDITNTMVYVNVVNSIPTGIVENQELNISLSPNPATTEIVVESAEFNVERIEMYNVVGERVLTHPQPPLSSTMANAQRGLRIDVSSLRAGIYFVAVTDDVGNKVVRKIVKM
jgi:hypothetical protein